MVALDKTWRGLQTVIMMDEIIRPKKMLQRGSVGFIAVVNPHNNSHHPNLPQKACQHINLTAPYQSIIAIRGPLQCKVFRKNYP